MLTEREKQKQKEGVRIKWRQEDKRERMKAKEAERQRREGHGGDERSRRRGVERSFAALQALGCSSAPWFCICQLQIQMIWSKDGALREQTFLLFDAVDISQSVPPGYHKWVKP